MISHVCNNFQCTYHSLPPCVDDLSCPLEYLEQPPDQLNCNPYPRGELLLECTVSLQSEFLHHHGLSVSEQKINWFHSQNRPEAGETEVVPEGSTYQNEQTPLTAVQLEDMQENVSIREQTRVIGSGSKVQVRSRLELYGLNESDVGEYWCVIHLNYTDESLPEAGVAPSDSVLLGHPCEYAHREQCSTNIAQSKQENKCALRSIAPLPWLSASTIIPDGTATTPPSVAEKATLVGENSEEQSEEKGPTILKEFYIALGILIAFGSVIGVLALVMVCTCVHYRRMLKGMELSIQYVLTMHEVNHIVIIK